MVDFLTMDEYEFKDKTAFVRVDFNSPLNPKTMKITDDTRIRMHSQTIKELVDMDAKVVVLAHQGRPGRADFSTLEQHASVLSKILGKPVIYVNDLFDDKAKASIKKLKPGEILVLENVRTFPGETKKKTPEEFAESNFVKNLAPLADVYVGDGFAVAHRSQASLVGFPHVLPAVAGRIMERELKALNKVKRAEEKPCVYVMGGAKADDSALISNYVLSHKTADHVLTGGIIGHLFLHAKGVNIGDPNVRYLEKNQFLQYVPRIQELFKNFNGKILTPEDFAIDVDGKRKEITLTDLPSNYPMFDIGSKTVEKYANILEKAKIVVLSGPMGVYENNEFMAGTKGVFDVVAKSSAFSVAGGGNTIEAIERLGLKEKISYISTGGGALMEFLTGKTLPGVKALEKAKSKKQ
ncbi:MAG: phosphoglycerate kinase [Candidatus Bathyarchaeota archaeon]|nr:MAG: phosphoglycerate kinase [Candidatus Bathyarchaeota archaeon]